jgi:F420-dependent oxidoreductase-like protein
MKAGLVIPQGWKYEYNGWDPAIAWSRTLDLARHAEDLGFESEWVFDHFHTSPDPMDEITFESFTTLTAIAGVTSRVRLGPMVICAGFRNPALVAKMAATLDIASGGRLELGIGGGWKEEEWLAYGYGFPPISDRLGALSDGLEIITLMFAPGRATYGGKYASVNNAINVPKGIQKPRPPIVVGGNGPEVTFRLAARFADELNLVHLGTDQAAELMAIARERCEEIGRDPATLRLSLYCTEEDSKTLGQRRVDFIGRCAQIGLDRLMAFPTIQTPTREAQAQYAEDCRAAGVELASPTTSVA